MASCLLDTHLWLWFVEGDWSQARPDALETLEKCAERNQLSVSEVSFWEVARKARQGTLEVLPNARAWLKRAARTPGIGIVQIDRDVLIDSVELDLPVRDPADRMLVATALKYDLRLATADKLLLDYAEQNKALSVLDCRVT